MIRVVMAVLLLVLPSCAPKEDYYVHITPCEHCIEQLATDMVQTTGQSNEHSYDSDTELIEELVS